MNSAAPSRHFLDACTQFRLDGWSTASALVIAVNDGEVGRIAPDLARPDLALAGIAGGHGFSFALARPLWIDDEVSLHGPDGGVHRQHLDRRTAARIGELTQFLPLHLPGLEIGPLDRPLIPNTRFPVRTLDIAARDRLLAAYAGHGLNLAALGEADFVAEGRAYAEAVGGARFSYAVASHVIEHVPDMIGWLWQVWSVLQDKAVLALAIPDGRHSFDRARPPTGLNELVEDYFAQAVRPGARHIIGAAMGSAIHHGLDITEAAFHAFHRANHARKTGLYCDTHCSVFTPDSFTLLLRCLDGCGLLGFDVLRVAELGTDEFFAHLRRNGAKTLAAHMAP